MKFSASFHSHIFKNVEVRLPSDICAVTVDLRYNLNIIVNILAFEVNENNLDGWLIIISHLMEKMSSAMTDCLTRGRLRSAASPMTSENRLL